jgi:hypothetical protein
MSNKTLKQRIAIVAASALTAGVMSVIATPSATAFDSEDGNITSTAGSTGLIAAGTITSNTADTTKTGVILSTGTLKLTLGEASTVVVSEGARITANSQSANAGISADQTCSTVLTGGAGTVTIAPIGAVGTTFTVSTYAENACADAATLNERATITIAGSDLSGGAVPANSYINWAADGSTAATTESAANAADISGGLLFIYVQLRDAYLANVTSTSGALIATASAGALTKIAATGGTTTGTAATSVSAASPAALWVAVGEATAGAGWAGTVTISYNGVVLATKTGKISGTASKLTVAPLLIGKNDGNTSAAAFAYQVTDAAGNNIAVTATDIVYDSSTNAALVSAAVGSVNNSTSAAGAGTFTCANSASLTGTADIVMKTTLSDGTVIKSNSMTVRCGGAAAKYTASWDKAVYSQGDVAKLTVKFTDAVGAIANSYDDLSASTNQVVTAPQMERVTAYPTAAEADADGNFVYTFTVGTSSGAVAGKYNAVVSFPTVNTAGAAIGAANITASYEIAGTGAVSNADVLKSIVSLIASINKQIRALQKLILKR